MPLQSIMHGKPTGHDRDLMMARFRQLQVNEVIEHRELASIIGEDPKADRYRTVLQVARKAFAEETGVELQAVIGVGLLYPTGDDQVKTGVKHMRYGVRKIYRSARTTANVTDERITDKNVLALRDHTVQRMRYVAELARVEHRALMATVGKPTPQPQMAPPK